MFQQFIGFGGDVYKRQALQFEMMMDRSHLENALVGHLEVADLDDVAHGLDDEQTAKEDVYKRQVGRTASRCQAMSARMPAARSARWRR